VESGDHKTLMSNEGGAYVALVELQESSKDVAEGPSLSRQKSMMVSRGGGDSMSRRTFSFGASDKESSLGAFSRRFGSEKN
jgi:hypothetical protein